MQQESSQLISQLKPTTAQRMCGVGAAHLRGMESTVFYANTFLSLDANFLNGWRDTTPRDGRVLQADLSVVRTNVLLSTT